MHSHTYRKVLVSTLIFKFISGYRIYFCSILRVTFNPALSLTNTTFQGMALNDIEI